MEMGSVDSSFGRPVLFADTFDQAKLAPSWKVHATKAYARASFANEGKPGEIYTLPNTSVYAEHPLPAETVLVEAEINPGTDGTSSWGPLPAAREEGCARSVVQRTITECVRSR